MYPSRLVAREDDGQPTRLTLTDGGALARQGEEVRHELFLAVNEAIRGAPDPAVRLAALGLENSREVIHAWASSVRHRVRNSQIHGGFDTTGRTARLNEWAHRHGVVLDRVVNEVTARHFPLLPLTTLHSRVIAVAPVRFSMIVLDDAWLGFAGPQTDDGEPTLWMTSSPALLGLAVDLARAQVSQGHTIDPLPVTEVNVRRLWVLIHLLNGLTDAAIARRLQVSVRLVERDVHVLKEMAGVGTRMEIMWGLGFAPRGGHV